MSDFSVDACSTTGHFWIAVNLAISIPIMPNSSGQSSLGQEIKRRIERSLSGSFIASFPIETWLSEEAISQITQELHGLRQDHSKSPSPSWRNFKLDTAEGDWLIVSPVWGQYNLHIRVSLVGGNGLPSK